LELIVEKVSAHFHPRLPEYDVSHVPPLLDPANSYTEFAGHDEGYKPALLNKSRFYPHLIYFIKIGPAPKGPHTSAES